MQIDGLERKGRAIVGDRSLMADSDPLSTPDREHLRNRAFRRILLVVSALDGIPEAFRVARVLLDRLQGEIIVLEDPSQARSILSSDDLADGMNRSKDIDLLEIRRPSLNAASIDQVAHEYRCDLVILTMQSQANGRRMMGGCIAEEVFRRLKCPAIVLGPMATRSPYAGPKDGPVLFATSFQDRNMAAIRLASRVASLCDSSLECVHVLPAEMAETNRGCQIVPQIMRNALVAGAKQNQVSLRPEQCHILYGHSISDAVAKFAALRKARFITLGVQQTSAVASHLSLGITASTIVSAPCPVLTLASRDEPDMH